MRTLTFLMVSGALAMGASGSAGAMSPASGTIDLRATATFSDGTSADRLYRVTSDADSDGDGLNDSGWLRVACDGAAVSAVYYTVKSPRDAASGQASGKRMHKPFTITKEWGKSTPMLGKTGGGGGGGVVGSTVSWDLGKGKSARVDHSRASDASAGKGAAGERTATYDVKKVEGTGARTGQWDQATNKGAKTMAHDSWMAATLKEGSPNLCD